MTRFLLSLPFIALRWIGFAASCIVFVAVLAWLSLRDGFEDGPTRYLTVTRTGEDTP